MRQELNKMIDRAVTDHAYLERALADPQAAAAEVGVMLTSEEIAQAKSVNLHDAEIMLRPFGGGGGC